MGKNILITGASSGIGEELARVLGEGREGNRLFLLGGRTKHADMDTCLDVRNPISQETVSEILRGARLHLLIHCAGVLQLDSERNAHTLCMRTNAEGTRHVLEAFLTHMHSGGRVVLLNSIAGLVSFDGMREYSRSKRAARRIALEYMHATRSVQFSIVYPPVVKTRMVTRYAIEELPLVDRVFPWVSPDEAVARILAGIRDDKQEIFLSRTHQMLALVAKASPRTFSYAMNELVALLAWAKGIT